MDALEVGQKLREWYLTREVSSLSAKALEYAVEITKAWVTAAGAGDNEHPARFVAAVTPEAVTTMLESVYRKASALEAETQQVPTLPAQLPLAGAAQAALMQAGLAAGELAPPAPRPMPGFGEGAGGNFFGPPYLG